MQQITVRAMAAAPCALSNKKKLDRGDPSHSHSLCILARAHSSSRHATSKWRAPPGLPPLSPGWTLFWHDASRFGCPRLPVLAARHVQTISLGRLLRHAPERTEGCCVDDAYRQLLIWTRLKCVLVNLHTDPTG